jgi:outer membrane protein TolC
MIPNIYKMCLCIEICLVVWFLFAMGVPATHAGDQKGTTVSCDLATCIQIALARHPELQVAESRALAAQSKVEFEKAQWRPQLDFKGESGYLNGKSTGPFAVISGVTEEGVPQRQVSGGYYAGSLMLNVPIVREGKIFGWNSPSVQQARFSLTTEEQLQLTRQKQIIYNVTAAFINVLKTSEVVQENEQVVKLTEPQYQLALAKFKQNLVSRNDLLIAEVQLATAKRELALARNAMARAKSELAGAMGLEGGSSVDILDTQSLPAATATLPAVEELLAFAYQHRPEVQAQQAQIQAKAEEVKRVRSERFPSLQFVAEYNFANAFDPPVATQWRTVAQVTGPIFDFGRNAQKVGLARAQMTEEVRRLESLKVGIAGEVQDAYTRITDTLAQLDLLDKQIEQAREALKLNQSMFAQQLLPEATLAEVQKALTKLTQAKALAHYDLLVAYSQLGLVTGGWKRR